jgi:hypothetical protein
VRTFLDSHVGSLKDLSAEGGYMANRKLHVKACRPVFAQMHHPPSSASRRFECACPETTIYLLPDFDDEPLERLLQPLVCCAYRKLNPGILVMQSAQDWATKNVPGAIDGARDRCILLQG